MISIPIWLLVILCIFGFIGVCTTLLLIYAIFSAIFIPIYRYDEEKEEEYGKKQSETIEKCD